MESNDDQKPASLSNYMKDNGSMSNSFSKFKNSHVQGQVRDATTHA